MPRSLTGATSPYPSIFSEVPTGPNLRAMIGLVHAIDRAEDADGCLRRLVDGVVEVAGFGYACVSSAIEGRQRVLHEHLPTDQTATPAESSSDDEIEALIGRSQAKHSDVVTRPLVVGDGAEHLGLLIAVNSGGESVTAGQHDAIEGLPFRWCSPSTGYG